MQRARYVRDLMRMLEEILDHHLYSRPLLRTVAPRNILNHAQTSLAPSIVLREPQLIALLRPE